MSGTSSSSWSNQCNSALEKTDSDSKSNTNSSIQTQEQTLLTGGCSRQIIAEKVNDKTQSKHQQPQQKTSHNHKPVIVEILDDGVSDSSIQDYKDFGNISKIINLDDESKDHNADHCQIESHANRKENPTNNITSSSSRLQSRHSTTISIPCWRRGRERQDSLRIPVSNIAALSGYHPYKILPELIMNLVYQGRDGQALMAQDAKVLGLELVLLDEDPEKVLLRDMARLAGSATVQALNHALSTKTTKTAKEAKDRQQVVMKAVQKSGKLPAAQVEQFQKGLRSVVSTQFGTYHESYALDWLQKTMKCEIRNRNSEILEWPFTRVPVSSSKVTTEFVAVPMGPPRSKRKWHNSEMARNKCSTHESAANKRRSDLDKKNSSSNQQNNEAKDKMEGSPLETDSKTIATKIDQPNPCGRLLDVEMIDLTGEDVEGEGKMTGAFTKSDNADRCAEANESSCPFFYIVGSVDGIRDEWIIQSHSLFCQENSINNGDDKFKNQEEEWCIQSSVVEVKHRMNRLHKQGTTPLYDQIQAVVYCLMYNVRNADLVEVLRVNKKQRTAARSPKKRQRRRSSASSTKTRHVGTTSDDDTIERRGIEISDSLQKCKKLKELGESLLSSNSVQATVTHSIAKTTEKNGPSVDEIETTGVIESTSTNVEPAKSSESCSPLASSSNSSSAKKSGTLDKWFKRTDTTEPQKARHGLNNRSQHKNWNMLDPDMNKLGGVKSEVQDQHVDDQVSILSNNQSSTEQAGSSQRPNHSEQERNPRRRLLESERSRDHPVNGSDDVDVKCCIHCISLDDPIMGHEKQWESYILPRLQSMVELVYRMRQNDGQRYQLLLTVSEGLANGKFDNAWVILFQECPWLEECDDAWQACRRSSSSTFRGKATK